MLGIGDFADAQIFIRIARQFKKRRHAGRNSTSFTILHGCSASAAPDFNGTAQPEMDNGRVRELASKLWGGLPDITAFHHRAVGRLATLLDEFRTSCDVAAGDYITWNILTHQRRRSRRSRRTRCPAPIVDIFFRRMRKPAISVTGRAWTPRRSKARPVMPWL